MTCEEKVKIIKVFHSNTDTILPALLAAANGSIKEKSIAVQKVMNVFEPVVNMYVGELNKATNPASELTAPVVIMLLRSIADGLAKHYPGAEKIADILNKLFTGELLNISKNVGTIT